MRRLEPRPAGARRDSRTGPSLRESREQRLWDRLNESPGQECDLIMKGGVTSGVVFPPAILKLARKYRFHSIGGASAGAIAAAAAAAAEYGRQAPLAPGTRVPPSTQGFARLAKLNAELTQPDFVKRMFQPAKACQPLYEAFLAFRQGVGDKCPAHESRGQRWRRHARNAHRWRRKTRAFLRQWLPGPSERGKAVGALIALFLLYDLGGWGVWLLGAPSVLAKLLGVALLVLLGVLGWSLTLLAGTLGGALALGREVIGLKDKARAKYGICPGSAGPEAHLADEAHLALTDWLHVRFNQLAGLPPDGPPLTLSQLLERGIHFKLVTCNLTLGQPYILPMQMGNRSFFFKKSEMERLFPPPVVKALVDWGTRHRKSRYLDIRDEDAGEFLRFPYNEDIPLVVATRMSLSFPVLLSAVRLYSVKDERYKEAERTGVPQPVDLEKDIEEHWLSDGGIASNFPIHVFDTWVPRRPTFGITLYDSPIEEVLEQRSREGAPSVFLPRPRDFDKARPQRTAIDSVPDFLRAVFETAQSYRDNAQAGLPSYRERIVQIFLDRHEGGLNLDMPRDVIQRMQGKGRRAARALLRRYPSTASPSFSEHRWVRMQVLMAELERHFQELGALMNEERRGWLLLPYLKRRQNFRAWLKRLFDEQVQAERNPETRWYRGMDKRRSREACQRLMALVALIERWDTLQRRWARALGPLRPEAQGFFTAYPPKPPGLLKVAPDL